MLRCIVVVVAVLVPSLARAEFIAKKPEVRPAATAKVVQEPLTVDGVLRKINTVYMLGMQRCYVKGLSQDPSLTGKVTVAFTVNAWGHVSGTATGVAPQVDACLTNQLGRWQFPAPRDNKAKPTEASFKISLVLRQ
jgi:hypothetical protein